MKNSTYRRLRKHLAYLYLFMTALVMGIIGILIFLLDHYAQVFSNQGTLRDSDFLLFYLKHELEFQRTQSLKDLQLNFFQLLSSLYLDV